MVMTAGGGVDKGRLLIEAWIDRFRQFSKDYERKVQTSEYRIQMVMTRLMLKRLARAS